MKRVASSAGRLTPAPLTAIAVASEWDGHRRLHLVGQLVHGVGADQQPFGAARLQLARRLGQQHARSVPVAVMLPLGYLGEVEGMEQQLGRMQPAQPLAHNLVEQAIIDRRRFPAHAADEAK